MRLQPMLFAAAFLACTNSTPSVPTGLLIPIAPAPVAPTRPSATDAGAAAAPLAVRLDAYFSAYAAASDFAGVALVARGDSTLFEKAYGAADLSSGTPNTTGTRFRVASISKTFTGAAIALLAERGKLQLDDALSKYLPRFPRGGEITLRQLLLHKSGVGAVTDADVVTSCLPEDALVQRIARAKRQFEPGKGSSYSNEGFFLLSLVVEKVSGVPFAAFLEDNFFRPLGMSDSGTGCFPPPASAHGHVPDPNGTPALRELTQEEAGMMGAGAVYSTARDLLAWMRALRAGKPLAFGALAYPYGWGKRHYGAHDLVEQTGILAGFTGHIALYATDDTYAIVLSNVQSGITNRLAHDLHGILFGDEPDRHVSAPPESRAIGVAPETLASIQGDYSAKSIPVALRFRVQDGRLASHWGDDPFRMTWTPVGEDEFFARQEYVKAHFHRDEGGSVSGATLTWPEGEPLEFSPALTENKRPRRASRP
jgi:CubicO group peptidase (beta-lactamase class C family)